MFSPQSVALKFFSLSRDYRFHYFRNMISLLISQLYFEVTLFNLKILTIVLDHRFLILCVLFDTVEEIRT